MGLKVVFLTVNANFHLQIIDFKGEKIENHHMADYRHIDMFSGTESHQEIDSARLEIQKSPFKRSTWGEKFTFQR